MSNEHDHDWHEGEQPSKEDVEAELELWRTTQQQLDPPLAPPAPPPPVVGLTVALSEDQTKLNVMFIGSTHAEHYEVYLVDPSLGGTFDRDDPSTYETKVEASDVFVPIGIQSHWATVEINVFATNQGGISVAENSTFDVYTALNPPPKIPTGAPLILEPKLTTNPSATEELIFDYNGIVESMEACQINVYLSSDLATPIDPLDQKTYNLKLDVFSSGDSYPVGYGDYQALVVATNILGAFSAPIGTIRHRPFHEPPEQSQTDAYYYAGAPSLGERIKENVQLTYSPETPKIRFVPLRTVDESVGEILDKALRRLSSLDMPKGFAKFMERERLLHWGAGETAEETLSLLGRTGGGVVQLPLVVLSRNPQVEVWTEELGVPSWKTPFVPQGHVGFYPMRLTYRLLLMSFEQTTLDALILALFTQLQDHYRQKVSVKLEGADGLAIEVNLTLLETSGTNFTAEPANFQQQRLFSASAEFSVGSFTYHVPEETKLVASPRFVFDSLYFTE